MSTTLTATTIYQKGKNQGQKDKFLFGATAI